LPDASDGSTWPRAFQALFSGLFFPDQPVQGLDASTEDTLLLADFLIEEGDQAQPELP
jgi:hypothetical protein